MADRFVVIKHFQRLRIVTAAGAFLARHERARQKIHLQFDRALALTGLAASALGVERESAGRITAHPRDRQLRVKLANFVKYLSVNFPAGGGAVSHTRGFDS